MLVVPILFLMLAMGILLFAGYLMSEKEMSFSIILVAASLICITFSMGLLVDNVTTDIDEEVKTKVLQHLTYTEDVTLTPDADGTFFYELNDTSINDLFNYVTTDRYNKLREVE